MLSSSSAKASQKKKISTRKKKILAPKYKRILLKLSGEALMGEDSFGINRHTIESIVGEIAQVARMGVELGVGIGGGDTFPGRWRRGGTGPPPTTWECLRR